MPRHTMECDPQLYLFLIRNPEVVVNIWDVMGATQIEMQRTGPYTFNATDGAGTKSKVELAYGTNNLHIYFGDGLYEGSMLGQRVPGRAVLSIAFPIRTKQSRPKSHHECDGHVRGIGQCHGRRDCQDIPSDHRPLCRFELFSSPPSSWDAFRKPRRNMARRCSGSQIGSMTSAQKYEDSLLRLPSTCPTPRPNTRPQRRPPVPRSRSGPRLPNWPHHPSSI